MRSMFRKTIAGAAVVVMSAAVAVAADAQRVENDAFSIALPAGFGEFESQAQTANSPEGTIETTNWVSKAPTGEAIVVTMSKMPGKILDPEKMIASTRDSLLKSVNAKLESENNVADELPHTVLNFRSQSEPPVLLTSHLLVDDDRLYQVLYVGRSEEQRAAPAIDAMFDSFTIASAPAEPTTTASVGTTTDVN